MTWATPTQGVEGVQGHLVPGHGLAAGQTAHQAVIDAQGAGVRGHGDLPAGAGVLTVDAVAHGGEQHLAELVGGDLLVGQEAAGTVAVDDAGVGAVGDVTGRPVVGGHIVKGSGHRRQVFGGVAQQQVGDDLGGLGTGHGVIRPIAAVGEALEHANARQDVHRLGIGDVAAVGVIIRTGRADCERERTQQRHHHHEAQQTFEVFHGEYSPPFQVFRLFYNMAEYLYISPVDSRTLCRRYPGDGSPA